jgi:hypothetical protein
MKSKWYELKADAILLRKRGLSIGKVESRLGIPRSTLSGWLKNIELTKEQREKLLKNWKKGLEKARRKAVLWHNAQKNKRLREAEEAAKETLKNIDIDNHAVLELALAFLYLGEGSKKNMQTSIGSSDPMILKFFLASLKTIYSIDVDNIKCELGLRADQSPEKMKHYWARALGLPIDNFKQINVDKRTKGSATYSYYKGVCHLRCGNIAIQRRLILLANSFCEKIISKNMGA